MAENPPETTATASTPTAISIAVVYRLIGPRGNPRSVRYQCPRQQSVRDGSEERRARQQLEQRHRVGLPARAPAIATSTAIDRGTLSRPTTLATVCCSASISRNVTPTATAVASASRTDQSPASSPGTRATFADHHAATASTSRIEDVRVKKPRFDLVPQGDAPQERQRAGDRLRQHERHVRPPRRSPVRIPHTARSLPGTRARASLAATPGRLTGHMDDWRSYDDVAETYERVHAPRFVQVADDLVAQAGIGEGHLLLDIGTGTGIAAEAATKVGARVVGIDESMGMLRRGPPSASRRGRGGGRGDRPAVPRWGLRRRDRQLRAGALHEVRDRAVRCRCA